MDSNSGAKAAEVTGETAATVDDTEGEEQQQLTDADSGTESQVVVAASTAAAEEPVSAAAAAAAEEGEKMTAGEGQKLEVSEVKEEEEPIEEEEVVIVMTTSSNTITTPTTTTSSNDSPADATSTPTTASDNAIETTTTSTSTSPSGTSKPAISIQNSVTFKTPTTPAPRAKASIITTTTTSSTASGISKPAEASSIASATTAPILETASSTSTTEGRTSLSAIPTPSSPNQPVIDTTLSSANKLTTDTTTTNTTNAAATTASTIITHQSSNAPTVTVSSLPITKEHMVLDDGFNFPNGFRNCLSCGKRGIKDTFYGRAKEYCSVLCRDMHRSAAGVSALRAQAEGSSSSSSSSSSSARRGPLKPFEEVMEGMRRFQAVPPDESTGSPSLLETRHRVYPGGKEQLHRINFNLPWVPPTREYFKAVGKQVRPGAALTEANLVNLGPLLDTIEVTPVNAFPELPLSRCWASLFTTAGDTMVEVCHQTTDGKEYSWPAKLVTSKGYYVKVQLIGKNKLYFLNPGMVNLFPLGFAALNRRAYGVPFRNYTGAPIPKMLENLMLTTRTIKEDLFRSFVEDNPPPLEFDLGKAYEVVDKQDPRQYLTARIVGYYGQWMMATYDLTEECLWVHPDTGTIRPSGWCQLIGVPIVCTRSYSLNSAVEFCRDPTMREEFALSMLTEQERLEWPPPLATDDSTDSTGGGHRWRVGAKLEVLDPFDRCFRAGTVVELFRFGYLQIRFDGRDRRELIFHFTSVLLYPATFCELNGIPLYTWPPFLRDPTDDSPAARLRPNPGRRLHSWRNYRIQPGEFFLPAAFFAASSLLQGRRQASGTFPPESRFRPKQVLESFNLRGHGVISLVMVMRVVGRLLLLDFITTPTGCGFWVDVDSPTLYPIGYSQMLQNRHPWIRYDNVPLDTITGNIRGFIARINAGEVQPSQEQPISPPTDQLLEYTMRFGRSRELQNERLMLIRRYSAAENSPANSFNGEAAAGSSSAAAAADQAAVESSEIARAVQRLAQRLVKKDEGEQKSVPQSSQQPTTKTTAKKATPDAPKQFNFGLAPILPLEENPEVIEKVVVEVEDDEEEEVAAAAAAPQFNRWQVEEESEAFALMARKHGVGSLQEPLSGVEHLPAQLRHWTREDVLTLLAGNFNLDKHLDRLTVIDKEVTGRTLMKLMRRPERVNELVAVVGDRVRFKLLLERLKENYAYLLSDEEEEEEKRKEMEEQPEQRAATTTTTTSQALSQPIVNNNLTTAEEEEAEVENLVVPPKDTLVAATTTKQQ